MRNFINFLNEAKEKEKCNLYFSNNFRNILKKIETNNVAQELLKSEGNIVADFSWIDIDQKDRWPAETAGSPIPDTEDGQIQK